MEMERMDFMDAVKLLAERAHLPIARAVARAAQAGISADERERIYEANARGGALFSRRRCGRARARRRLHYLYKRGLTDADIRHFGLGVAPRGWDATLQRHLTEQGFDERAAGTRRAGRATSDGSAYDMFRGRAIFPIISAQGTRAGLWRPGAWATRSPST